MRYLLFLSLALNCYLVYRVRTVPVTQEVFITQAAPQRPTLVETVKRPMQLPPPSPKPIPKSEVVLKETPEPSEVTMARGIDFPEISYEEFNAKVEQHLENIMRDELQIPPERIQLYRGAIMKEIEASSKIWDLIHQEKRYPTVDEQDLLTDIKRQRQTEVQNVLGSYWEPWRQYAEEFNRRSMSGTSVEELMGEVRPEATYHYVIPI